MDNLMLTHGWRRFRWDEVLSGSYRTPFVPEYRGHIIRGRVANAVDTSNAGIVAYLSWPGKVVRLHTARSNEKGEIQFEVKDFTGLRRLVAQTDLRQDSLHPYNYRRSILKQFCNDKATLLRFAASQSRNFTTGTGHCHTGKQHLS